MALINYFHFKDVALDILIRNTTSNEETDKEIRKYVESEITGKFEYLSYQVNRAYKKYCDQNRKQVRFKWFIKHSEKVKTLRKPNDNTIKSTIKKMYENKEIDLNPLFEIKIYTYEGLNGVMADVYQEQNTITSIKLKIMKVK